MTDSIQSDAKRDYLKNYYQLPYINRWSSKSKSCIVCGGKLHKQEVRFWMYHKVSKKPQRGSIVAKFCTYCRLPFLDKSSVRKIAERYSEYEQHNFTVYYEQIYTKDELFERMNKPCVFKKASEKKIATKHLSYGEVKSLMWQPNPIKSKKGWYKHSTDGMTVE